MDTTKTIARNTGIVTGRGVKVVGDLASRSLDFTREAMSKYRVNEAASYAKKKAYNVVGISSEEDQQQHDKLAKSIGILGAGAMALSYGAGAIAAAAPVAVGTAVVGGVA